MGGLALSQIIGGAAAYIGIGLAIVGSSACAVGIAKLATDTHMIMVKSTKEEAQKKKQQKIVYEGVIN